MNSRSATADVKARPATGQERRSSPPRPRSRRVTRRQRLVRLLFLLPLALYLPAVFAYPLAYNAWISFRKFDLRSLVTGTSEFVGLDNFATVLQNETTMTALRNTVIFTVVSLVVQYIVGLALATFFHQRFPLSGAMRSMLILPWLVPGVVTSTVWRWMFNDENGFINRMLEAVGAPPVSWLTSPTPALVAVTLVNIWVGISFNMVLLHGGLGGIPGERYEAAKVDGASAWQRFRHVTLPGLRPVTGVVLILGLVYTLKQFDIVWTLTSGGPGNSTQLLSTWSYSLSFVNNQFGQGAAVADVLFLLSIGLVILYATRQSGEKA